MALGEGIQGAEWSESFPGYLLRPGGSQKWEKSIDVFDNLIFSVGV